MVKKHAGYLIAAALILVLLISVSVPLVSAFQNAVQDTTVGEPFEPNYRNFVNGAFQTVASTFSGPSAPGSPYVGELWYNSVSGVTSQWNGSAWLTFSTATGGTGCSAVGASGVLQTSNGSGGCLAFGGNSTLGAHLFAKSQDASGNFVGAQPADSDISFTNNTTGNVSTSQHGYVPILPNSATLYLDGTGNWSTPAGSGGAGTILDAHAGTPYATQAAALNTQYTLYTFTVPGGTLGNTGVVRIDAGLTYTNTTSADTPSLGISFGSASELTILPVSIATGSNTGISLECAINALGAPGAQSVRCKLSLGNGTGAFQLYDFTLTQASGSNQALALLYDNTSSGNSTINLFSARVTSGL